MEQLSVVGKRVPREDSLVKLTGRAEYSTDISLPGMLHGKVLRSPYPHARIVSIDTSQAERLRGVKLVLTGKNTPSTDSPHADRRIFCTTKVRFIGDEVAAVAAVDADTAGEALELIRVEYEPLPAIFDPLEALQPDSVRIHDPSTPAIKPRLSPVSEYFVHEVSIKGNVIETFQYERGDVGRGFADSDCIVENTYTTPFVYQAYMEKIACLADYTGGRLTLWTTSMHPFQLHISLARVLNMSKSDIRVIQTYIGGAFGAKIKLMPVYAICALLAMKTGKPVKMAHVRDEDIEASRPRLGSWIKLKLGARKDGTLTAKQIEMVGDNGAYIDYGPDITIFASIVTGSLYRLRNIKADSRTVFTNKMPVGAYRGFGVPQMTFAVESSLDELAEKLGIDPVELRLKNATRLGDVTAHGWDIKSCALDECIRKAAEASRWREKKGKLPPGRGMGMVCGMFCSDYRMGPGFGGSACNARMLDGGKVCLMTGEPDYGQGSRTIYAQIAAEVLGISAEDVVFHTQDTDISPFTLGPDGDRVTISGGTAVKLAAEEVKRQLFEIAAREMEVEPADLDARGGKIFIRSNPDRVLTIAEVTELAIYQRGGKPVQGLGVDERRTVLMDETGYGNFSTAYTFGAQVAEVEVDRNTGQVKVIDFYSAHDLGRALNPMAAEGQVEGGLAQAIGHTLTENFGFKEGKVMNASPLKYGVPSSIDISPIHSILVQSQAENTPGPFGAKGVGEQSIIPPAAAIANAIYDAVGVRMRDFPITPQMVIKAIEAKKKSK
ncbi:MAG: xanthine dehydrogenase family protein [Chloroflexi bacterium]|nr:xanthine dehydrogenase family protein [Chloroflexota bacterium]